MQGNKAIVVTVKKIVDLRDKNGQNRTMLG
jgi:hypothetical protein